MALHDNNCTTTTISSHPALVADEKGNGGDKHSIMDEINKENNVNKSSFGPSSSTTTTTSSSPASVLGFTNKLIDRIQESKSLLNSYVKQQREKADAMIRKQAEVYEFERDEIGTKIQELKEIQYRRGLIQDGSDDSDSSKSGTDSSTSVVKGLVSERDEIDRKLLEVEKELMKLQLEHKKIDKNVKVVKEIEQCEFAKAEEVRRAKEKIETSKHVTVEDLTLAVLKYEMLGVSFVKGEDLSLRCKFTKIDPEEPERVFSFVLNIDEFGEEYIVEDCNPLLNAEVVYGLVNRLNQDESWSNFIVGMRDAFKRTL